MGVFKSQIWNQFFKHFILFIFFKFRHLVLKVHSQSLLWTWRELTLMMPSQEIFYFQHPYKTWIYYFCFKWFLKTKIFIVNYFWLWRLEIEFCYIFELAKIRILETFHEISSLIMLKFMMQLSRMRRELHSCGI